MKVASALSLIGFIVFAILVQTDSISWFDNPIIETVQGWESAGLTGFMETISTWGTTWYVVGIALVLMVLMALLLGHRKELVLFVVALIGSTLLNNILKNLFERDRPSLRRLAEEEGFSFPSGHAMAAFTLAVMTVYLLWKHIPSSVVRILAAVLAVGWFVLMGTSRIYLGVHYPSDVVAGYLFSGFWVSLILLALRGWISRTRSSGSLAYELNMKDLER